MHTVRMCARNSALQYLCSVRAHEPQKPQSFSAPCAYILIVFNGSKLAVA